MTDTVPARIKSMQDTITYLAAENRRLQQERNLAREVAVALEPEAESDYEASCWCHFHNYPGLMTETCEHDPNLALAYVGMPTLDELLKGFAEVGEQVDMVREGKYLDFEEGT